MLYTCPSCNGNRTKKVRKASRRKGESDEEVEVDCPTCDGSGKIDKPPAA